jgi:hypothetical protein
MKKLTFYEQVGILIPGAVLLFGIVFYANTLRDFLGRDGMTVGGLGVFIILAYAAGHLLAALGNLIEKALWRLFGGLPSNWIVGEKPRLLAPAQIARVVALAQVRFGLTVAAPQDLTSKDWFPIFRQIYSDVEKCGKPARADIFNGNYGLNRGLCSASLVLTIATLFFLTAPWLLTSVLVICFLAYLYRMYGFGVHYARETYNQFLLLPEELSSAKKSKAPRKARAKATPKVDQ